MICLYTVFALIKPPGVYYIQYILTSGFNRDPGCIGDPGFITNGCHSHPGFITITYRPYTIYLFMFAYLAMFAFKFVIHIQAFLYQSSIFVYFVNKKLY